MQYNRLLLIFRNTHSYVVCNLEFEDEKVVCVYTIKVSLNEKCGDDLVTYK